MLMMLESVTPHITQLPPQSKRLWTNSFQIKSEIIIFLPRSTQLTKSTPRKVCKVPDLGVIW